MALTALGFGLILLGGLIVMATIGMWTIGDNDDDHETEEASGATAQQKPTGRVGAWRQDLRREKMQKVLLHRALHQGQRLRPLPEGKHD